MILSGNGLWEFTEFSVMLMRAEPSEIEGRMGREPHQYTEGQEDKKGIATCSQEQVITRTQTC